MYLDLYTVYLLPVPLYVMQTLHKSKSAIVTDAPRSPSVRVMRAGGEDHSKHLTRELRRAFCLARASESHMVERQRHGGDSETPEAILSIGIAALIGVFAGCVGGLISWRHRHLLRHRPTLLSCFTAGLLIGLSLLSVLPEAMDELVSLHDWHTSDVLMLFLASAGAIFFLEHVLFTHEHAPYGVSVTTAAGMELGMAGRQVGLAQQDSAAAATLEPVNDSNGSALSSADVEMMCAPCDPGEAFGKDNGGNGGVEGQHERQTPAGGLDQAGASTPALPANRIWRSFLEERPCECCDEQGNAIAPTGSDAAASTAAAAAGVAAAPSATSTVQAAAGSAFRLLAWLVHAAIDGMVLSSITSQQLLVPAAFAVSVCALQDSLAFCVLLARARISRMAVCAALVLFSCSFPFGAGVASAVASGERGGDDTQQTLSLMRVVIAAVFVYMACELAPAHTHRRLLNLVHICVFALGVCVSSLAEMVERLTTGGIE